MKCRICKKVFKEPINIFVNYQCLKCAEVTYISFKDFKRKK